MRLLEPLGVIAVVVAVAFAAAPAGSTPVHSPKGTSTYLKVRPDMRLCPSPICGGWWARRVNRADTVCGSGLASTECYAATLDFSALELTDERRAALEQSLAGGTGLVRGRLVRAASGGPPRLDTLVVTEIWLRHGLARARGVIHRVEDNGIRCVRAPCFSWHASVLNTTRHQNVSTVDLVASGAPPAVIARARAALSRAGVLAEGRIVVAGEGRSLRAYAFWLRAA